MPLRSQQKCKAKVSAQSSHIRDLHCKLGTAIMENSQMWEFLNPSTLQNIITNALQAAHSSSHHCGNNSLGTREGKPFLGRSWEPQIGPWILIGTMYPNSSFSTNYIIIFSRSSPKDPISNSGEGACMTITVLCMPI